MWCIVIFLKDNTVEAVPTHWIKNGVCAWPIKDERIKIKNRVLPNKFDFNFYSVRILKKNISNYNF